MSIGFRIANKEDKEKIKNLYYDYQHNNHQIYKPFDQQSLDAWLERLLVRQNDKQNEGKELIYVMYR